MEEEGNNKVYKRQQIRKRIKRNKWCLHCIRKWSGRIRKYNTNC